MERSHIFSTELTVCRHSRDPEATQAQILDAAESEFAKHGLSGARIGNIAKRAGITTAMIHYYFNNKEGLYLAVLQRPVREIQEILQQLKLRELPPEEALSECIKGIIDYESKHRHRAMIMFHEANQNQGKYFQQLNWAGNFAAVLEVIERGIRLGIFRSVDPFLTMIEITGICVMYFTCYENIKHLRPDLDWLSEERIKMHTSQTIDLVIRGLRSNNLNN